MSFTEDNTLPEEINLEVVATFDLLPVALWGIRLENWQNHPPLFETSITPSRVNM